MPHEVQLFIAAVHKKVHITLIYVPLCRLCPFCDKKNAIRAQIRQNKFYSVNICSQATHCRRYLAPRCIAKGTDTSHLTVRTPLSCHGSFLSPLCCISSSARTPLPPSLPFGKLLLQKPLLIHPLPLRLYAVIAIILLRQQPFLQRICSIISAFPKSLILRVAAVLNCT